MKKIFLSVLSLGLIFSLNSCRDESLNPLPTWQPGLHAFTVFDGVAAGKNAVSRPQPFETDYAKNFPSSKQDAATAGVPFKIRWVSLDNLLTASKIEIYVAMYEYYNDADGNPKTGDLSGGVGKLITTISAPAANRQWNSFTLTPTQIYTAYKDATVKYDKVNAVKVFSNPNNPRPTGKWFNGTEDFQVIWKIYTSDGKVYSTWSVNLCADPTPYSEAAANCQLFFDVQ